MFIYDKLIGKISVFGKCLIFKSVCLITIKALNPISPGGGGGGIAPPQETFLYNSKTAQNIKMKYFKFNLTPMGIILHMMTILISLRCCHGNLFVMNGSLNRKVKKLAYLPGYWLDLAQIWCRGGGGIFGF